MTMETSAGKPFDGNVFRNYVNNLVNLFFKILPIREEHEESLPEYLRSLQLELIGCKDFILAIKEDGDLLLLIAMLQYLIDNPDCTVREVRREVFKAISICNKLKAKYLIAPDETR